MKYSTTVQYFSGNISKSSITRPLLFYLLLPRKTQHIFMARVYMSMYTSVSVSLCVCAHGEQKSKNKVSALFFEMKSLTDPRAHLFN